MQTGEVIIADIIGKGFYQIHEIGETYVLVKCLKLFGRGFDHHGHITSCSTRPLPIDMVRWDSYKRVHLKCLKYEAKSFDAAWKWLIRNGKMVYSEKYGDCYTAHSVLIALKKAANHS